MKLSFASKRLLIRIAKYLFIFGAAVVVALSLFIASVSFGFFGKIPTKSRIADISHAEASEIYDANGKVVGSFFRHYRTPVTYDQLPDHLIEALVATEDARFYKHKGIDHRSLVRVFVKTLLMGDESAGGGSTLSQQLAKNLYPRDRHNTFGLIVSKIKEAIIARRIENVFTKEEILTLYLNTVSFPENVFGIETASRTFFNKSVHELTLEEAATLVGTLKATYTYNPRIFPERSKGRRNVVLSQMVQYGDLPKDTAEVAMAKPIELDYKPYHHHAGPGPYFREEVRKQLHEWVEDNPRRDGTLYDIYNDGLKIYTTIDGEMQKMADKAVKKHMASLQKAFESNWGNAAPWLKNQSLIDEAVKKSEAYLTLERKGLSEQEIMNALREKRTMTLFTWQGEKDVQASTIDSVRHYLKFLQTGFVAVDPSSGAVRAWVGGIDHKYFQFDHVSQSRRQVGSTFKPVVYTAALEQGIDPCDYFSAREVKYTNMKDWTPTNDEEDYNELNFSMKAALAKSVNTVSIKILEKTGLNAVLDEAEDMHITSELPKVPSLVLGTAELSMLELAGAYASYANDSKPVQPYIITKITDRNGEVLAEFESEELDKAFSNDTREVMVEMLQAVVNEGTAARLRWKYGLKNDIAGKTGTTQSNKDGWFVGVTPKLVAVSWVGADDPSISFRSTSVGQGSNSALPIFAEFMKMLNQNTEYEHITKAEFPEPSEETVARLNCEGVKEDGFFKKLFTNSDEPQEREFQDKKRRLRWLREIFKKD